jgi:hypothetical protein
MSKIAAWLTALSTIVGALVAIQAGLAQLLPSTVQSFFNQWIRQSVETYLTSECDLSGNWVCNTSGCKNPRTGRLISNKWAISCSSTMRERAILIRRG